MKSMTECRSLNVVAFAVGLAARFRPRRGWLREEGFRDAGRGPGGGQRHRPGARRRLHPARSNRSRASRSRRPIQCGGRHDQRREDHQRAGWMRPSNGRSRQPGQVGNLPPAYLEQFKKTIRQNTLDSLVKRDPARPAGQGGPHRGDGGRGAWPILPNAAPRRTHRSPSKRSRKWSSRRRQFRRVQDAIPDGSGTPEVHGDPVGQDRRQRCRCTGVLRGASEGIREARDGLAPATSSSLRTPTRPIRTKPKRRPSKSRGARAQSRAGLTLPSWPGRIRAARRRPREATWARSGGTGWSSRSGMRRSP